MYLSYLIVSTQEFDDNPVVTREDGSTLNLTANEMFYISYESLLRGDFYLSKVKLSQSIMILVASDQLTGIMFSTHCIVVFSHIILLTDQTVNAVSGSPTSRLSKGIYLCISLHLNCRYELLVYIDLSC